MDYSDNLQPLMEYWGSEVGFDNDQDVMSILSDRDSDSEPIRNET